MGRSKMTKSDIVDTVFEDSDVKEYGMSRKEVAVVIVIEHGHPAGHGFRSMALRRLRTVQLEVDRLVSEVNGRLGILSGQNGPESEWQ